MTLLQQWKVKFYFPIWFTKCEHGWQFCDITIYPKAKDYGYWFHRCCPD